MIDSLKIILIILITFLIIFIYIKMFKSVNIPKEERYKQYTHIAVLLIEIIISVIFYIIETLISNIKPEFVYNFKKISPFVIITLIINIYLLYKSIYFILYKKNKIKKEPYKLPKHYYKKNNKYYIIENYYTISKVFKILIIILILVLIMYIFLTYLTIEKNLYNNLDTIYPFLIIITLFLELSSYFDGVVEENNIENNIININNDNYSIEKINDEYQKIFSNNLLITLSSNKEYNYKITNNIHNNSLIGENIVKELSTTETNKIQYSKILNSIVIGKNIIIENCHLEKMSMIFLPIINLLFTASKKILFICDSKKTIKYCEKWLEELEIKSSTANSNIVIEVLNYDSSITIKKDNNIDIYISTADLILENKSFYESIDVVIGLNIDCILTNNIIDLNLLISAINNNKKSQFILLGNRVNGIKQIISQIFMSNEFDYLTIEPTINNKLITNFWKKENEWLQFSILPNFQSQYLGQLVPLTVPAIKHDATKINIISSSEPCEEQITDLKMAQNILRNYTKKDIININEIISCTENENIIKINDKAILIVEDINKNTATTYQKYIKYNNIEMLLNIVSEPYILRDYINSNIDFFIGNAQLIDKILLIPKFNIKLLLYKIINRLCNGYIKEDILLKEIQDCQIKTSINLFEENQTIFIIKSLNEITKKAYNIDIPYELYLVSENNINNNKYYKLIDSVKNELPISIFKNVSFIDSEQKAKIIKKMPIYEVFQNYLENQYATIDGKYYFINKIDYENGIIDLIQANCNKRVSYRQKREITQVIKKELLWESPVKKINKSIITQKIMSADIIVTTEGYYEFDNYTSFKTGEYSYNKINSNKKGLIRNYNSNDILYLNISSNYVNSQSPEEVFKISFTISLLFNELFETLFPNDKQYILLRSIINKKTIMAKYKKEEIMNLYMPIIDTEVNEGINICIIEDTELEKGIIETITTNLETYIIPLVLDYLNWILYEKSNQSKKIISFNNEVINFKDVDKLSFLRYGKKDISSLLDLENTYKVLKDIIIDNKDNISINRKKYIEKRKNYNK